MGVPIPEEFTEKLPKANLEHNNTVMNGELGDKKADAYLAVAFNTAITKLYKKVFSSEQREKHREDKSKKKSNQNTSDEDKHSAYVKLINKALENKKDNLTANKLCNYLLSSRLQDLKNEFINSNKENKNKLIKQVDEILSGAYSHEEFVLVYLNIIDKIRLYLNHHKIHDIKEIEREKLKISLKAADLGFLKDLEELAKQAHDSKLDLKIQDNFNQFPNYKKSSEEKLKFRKLVLFILSFTLKKSELNRLLDKTYGLKYSGKKAFENDRLVLSYFCKRDKRKDFYQNAPDLEDVLKSYSWLHSLPASYGQLFTETDLNLIKENFQKFKKELVSENNEDSITERNLDHLWRTNQDEAFSLFLNFWEAEIANKSYSPRSDNLVVQKINALGKCKLKFALDNVLVKNQKTEAGLPLEPELKKVLIFKDTLGKDSSYPFNNPDATFHDKEKSIIDNRLSKNRLYLSQNNAFFRIVLIDNSSGDERLTVNFRIAKSKLISFISRLINEDLTVNESLIEDFMSHCLALAFDDEYLLKELPRKQNPSGNEEGSCIASLERIKSKAKKSLDEKILDEIKARKLKSNRVLKETLEAVEEGRNLSKSCIDYVIEVINSYLDENSLKALKQESSKNLTRERKKLEQGFRKIKSREDFDLIREQLIYFRRKEKREGFIESLRKSNPELIVYCLNIDSLDKLIENLADPNKGAYIKFLKMLETNLTQYSEEEKRFIAAHRLGLRIDSVYKIQDEENQEEAYIRAMRKIQFPRELDLNTSSERLELTYGNDPRYQYFQSIKNIYQEMINTEKNIQNLKESIKNHFTEYQQPARFSGCISVNRIPPDCKQISDIKTGGESRMECVRSALEKYLQSTYPILKDIKLTIPLEKKLIDKVTRQVKPDLYLDTFLKRYIYFLIYKVSQSNSPENKFYEDYEDKQHKQDKLIEVCISFPRQEGTDFPLNNLKPVLKFSAVKLPNQVLEISLDSLNTLLSLIGHYRIKDIVYVLLRMAIINKDKREFDYNEISQAFNKYYGDLDNGLSDVLKIEASICDLAFYFKDLTFTKENTKKPNKPLIKQGFEPYQDWLEERLGNNQLINLTQEEKEILDNHITKISEFRNSCCHDDIAGLIQREVEIQKWSLGKSDIFSIDSSFEELKRFLEMLESKCSAKPS